MAFMMKAIRCDTIAEFYLDWKAEYSALSIAHDPEKKNYINKRQCPLEWSLTFDLEAFC